MSAVSDDYLARVLPVLPISIVVRTLASPASVSKPVVDAIHSVDRDAPVEEILLTETILTESLAEPRLASLLLGTFPGLALLLAAVRIYGVMSYNVSQRTHEIGIRMALGAQHSVILGLVVKNGMLLGLIGLAAGLASATALSRFLKGLLFGVGATDPVTLLAVAILLAVVVFLACYIPARRAMRVDPMVALRQD
jgi:putative ABC transport system permease protein